MATIKRRLNITLPESVEAMVLSLAKRDQVSVAIKACELLEQSLLLHEDEVLTNLGEARLKSLLKKTLSHQTVWDK